MKRAQFSAVGRKMDQDELEVEDDEPRLSEERLRRWEREQEMQDLQLAVDDCSRNLHLKTDSS